MTERKTDRKTDKQTNRQLLGKRKIPFAQVNIDYERVFSQARDHLHHLRPRHRHHHHHLHIPLHCAAEVLLARRISSAALLHPKVAIQETVLNYISSTNYVC